MRLRASCCSRHPSVRCDSSSVVCSSFFFQAEDGIRDFHVTGVQTCALPIWEVFLFSSRYKIFQIFTRTDEFLSKYTTGIILYICLVTIRVFKIKKLVLLLFVTMTTLASAQKMKVTSGDFKFLKGEKELNLVMDYSNVKFY